MLRVFVKLVLLLRSYFTHWTQIEVRDDMIIRCSGVLIALFNRLKVDNMIAIQFQQARFISLRFDPEVEVIVFI